MLHPLSQTEADAHQTESLLISTTLPPQTSSVDTWTTLAEMWAEDNLINLFNQPHSLPGHSTFFNEIDPYFLGQATSNAESEPVIATVGEQATADWAREQSVGRLVIVPSKT
jgi:hypothetical protein